MATNAAAAQAGKTLHQPIPRRPADENIRLETLRQHEILDTAPEQPFDDLALLASHICGTPISLVSLIDTDRQWFKAKVGLPVTETPRDVSFCAHAILQPDLFVVGDTRQDERFADNPLVTGDPGIRFYAGMPLFSSEGHQPLGTLCVIDRVPRELTPAQKELMEALARQAQRLFDLRLRLTQEKRLSRIDLLTGASNRRALYESLEGEFSRLRRHGRPFSVAYLDLDNMKKVNDTLGHEMGDALLRTVSETIRKNLRKSDVIARMGGDEFAILLAETTEEGARLATEKFRNDLLANMQKNKWAVTFSIGVVTCLKVPASIEHVMKQADDLMYKVKKAGKNDIAFAQLS